MSFETDRGLVEVKPGDETESTKRGNLILANRPLYPYEARRHRITGSGIALLIVDPTDGDVTAVQMAQSCGNAILDNATLGAFRRWRFKPGTAPTVQVPITYTLTGASY